VLGIVLADANAFGEPLLRHVKAAHLPDAATYLIVGSLRPDRTLGLTSSCGNRSESRINMLHRTLLSARRCFETWFYRIPRSNEPAK
jgi:hypothetical protein